MSEALTVTVDGAQMMADFNQSLDEGTPFPSHVP